MPNIFFEIAPEKISSRLDRERIIFVEGPDDANFLDLLLADAGATPDKVAVITVSGKGNFPSQLNLFSKSRYFTAGNTKKVCIIRDADDNPGREVLATKAIFEKTFGVATEHNSFYLKNGVEFGFFMMPNATEQGDLEKLCLSTIEGSELDILADKFFNSLTQPPEDKKFKRKAQVYLAGHSGDLARGAGQGFKDGYFDISSHYLDEIKSFLEKFIS